MKTDLKQSRPLTGIYVVLSLVLIVLDQLTKAYFVFRLGTHNSASFQEFIQTYFRLWGEINGQGGIVGNYFPYHSPIPVWHPWIEFRLTTNTGAAWSLMTGNSFLLSFVSLTVACILTIVWWRYFRHKRAMTWAMGGILGGALGNFIDRFRLKEVVDFIDVKIPYIGKLFTSLGDPYDFPIFNIADSAAVCGTLALAAYLIITDIRSLSRRRKKPSITPFPEGHQLDYDPEALESIRQRSSSTPAGSDNGPGPDVTMANPVEVVQQDGEAEDER